jgi:hypothetical protein
VCVPFVPNPFTPIVAQPDVGSGQHLAYCEDGGQCSCPEGFWGDGVGVDGCQTHAASIKLEITIPMKQVSQSKLLAQDLDPVKRDVKTMFNNPPNFDSTFHHSVTAVLTGNKGGLLLVMNVLYEDLTTAKAALAALDFGVDAQNQQLEYFDAKLGRKVGAELDGMPIRVTGDHSFGSAETLPTAQLWDQETITNVKTTIVFAGFAIAPALTPAVPPRKTLPTINPHRIRLPDRI